MASRAVKVFAWVAGIAALLLVAFGAYALYILWGLGHSWHN